MTENRFDEIAATWDESPFRLALARGVSGAILRAVSWKKSMRLLDFGCGTGLVSFPLADRVASITGLDSSREMVAIFNEKAGAHSIDATAKVFDFRVDPIVGPFDVVVSSMVFHHIPDPTVVIKQLHGALVTGGILCIADLDTEDGSFHGEGIEGIFHHGFDRTQMKRWLEEGGFDAVSVVDATTMTKEERLYPIFLASGTKR